jgi:hypothetical protein
LAQNAHSPQAGSRELLFQRVQNRLDVVRIARSNAPSDVRIVGDRFSSGCAFRSFGFCDLNSPDISGRDLVTMVVVMDDIPAVCYQNIEVMRPMVVTNLLQRCVEPILALPLNVFYFSSLPGSNLHAVRYARDERETAAGYRNHDYA